jgi:hypothetical protein
MDFLYDRCEKIATAIGHLLYPSNFLFRSRYLRNPTSRHVDKTALYVRTSSMCDTTSGNYYSGLEYNIMKFTVYANQYRQQGIYLTQFHGSASHFQIAGK